MFENAGELKYKELLAKFEEYFQPKKNLIFKRFQVLHQRQQAGESVDEFVMRLCAKASACEFDKAEKDCLIRDMLMIGILYNQVREELLQLSKLELDDAIAKCRVAELSRQKAQQMQSSNEASYVPVEMIRAHEQQSKSDSSMKCEKCNYTHYSDNVKCPALGQ